MTEPFGPWRKQPPLIGNDGTPHRVQYDPRRGHRCLPDCPGQHNEDRALLPVDAPYLQPSPPVTHSPTIRLEATR